MSDVAVERAYRELADRESGLGATPGFAGRTADYLAGAWRYDIGLLSLLPRGIEGATVLDYGAKYGHLAPLLFARGAKEVIAVDVEEDYISVGRTVFGRLYDGFSHQRSDRGQLPLQPESVDVVITNEVISHINPMFLETYYSDVARVLSPQGAVLISDGNNAANAEMLAGLPDLWDAWENGPDGRKTERDVVTRPYVERRREVILDRHPDLGEGSVDHLARNTSGLFGKDLEETIEIYVKAGKLIERPYRYGTVPTNPGPGGVVMERPFYPQQVIWSLMGWGLEARQVFHPQYREEVARLRDLSARQTKTQGEGWLLSRMLGSEPKRKFPEPDLSGAFSMFQILGTKPGS